MRKHVLPAHGVLTTRGAYKTCVNCLEKIYSERELQENSCPGKIRDKVATAVKNIYMKKLLEKDIQKLILDWLQRQKKTYVWRQNSGAMYAESKTGRHGFKTASVKGVSDIIGIWQGMPTAIEVKQPGEKPTENQQEFMENFARAGGISICAHSLEEVQRSLRQVMENSKPFEGIYIRNL